MADDIAVTAGSGTTVATDDVGGRHFQRVKVVWGADGTATDASAAAPFPVAQVGQTRISVTPTTTNGAYVAEDAVGGLLTFANAARVSGGSGLIQGITILCKSPLTTATVPALEIAFFKETFTAMTDNAAWAPSDADAALGIGSVPVSAWLVGTNNCTATRYGLAFPFSLTGTSLFAQVITHTGVTLTSTSDLVIGLQIIQD